MKKVIQATYHDGNLVLDEKLDDALGGQKLTLMLVAVESFSKSKLGHQERARQFLDWAQKYSAKLSPDYKFDHEEAHER